MARIKIEDLPVLEDLSPKEVKGIFGGSTIMNQGNLLGISVDGGALEGADYTLDTPWADDGRISKIDEITIKQVVAEL